MDLSYSSEAEAFRETVAKFLDENWPLPESDKEGRSVEEQHALFRRRATEAGYLYRSIPKQYGGSEQEPDVIAGQVIREEFGRKWAPMEVRGIGTMMLIPTLLERGEQWMKDKFVEKTLSGEITWCQGYSEPGSG
ncbi:MAG: acyl-CoA dehydrogenase family protein, partial [Myxococcota bacterium]|nr:acyl-CoA dehydrogenase family protein [Myxococcota bacterium]